MAFKKLLYPSKIEKSYFFLTCWIYVGKVSCKRVQNKVRSKNFVMKYSFQLKKKIKKFIRSLVCKSYIQKMLFYAQIAVKVLLFYHQNSMSCNTSNLMKFQRFSALKNHKYVSSTEMLRNFRKKKLTQLCKLWSQKSIIVTILFVTA